MRQWIRNEKGNVLIMVAMATAVLAGFGILTIDIGRMLVTKTQLQNAADAGALAGAGMFCGGTLPSDEEAKAEAKKIADSNQALEENAVNLDVADIDITIEHSGSANDVTVIARSDTRQYLLGLFNIFKNADPTVSDAQAESAVNAIATARCGGTCSVSCVKPFSIPDRWDDVTGVPGYMGEVSGRSRRPDWRGNLNYDFEPFTDSDNSGKWEPGETFADGNGNGQYDQENYHPALTGYGPDPIPGNFLSPDGDLGLTLTLHAGSPADAPAPGQYYSVDLPPINKMPAGERPPSGADEYRENIAECNDATIEAGDWLQLKPGRMPGPTGQGMSDLIAQDPDAKWDDATQSVIDSDFAVSPRIVLIPIHDPRIPMASGRNAVQVVKVAAFFMERTVGQGQVFGHFLKVRAPGAPCVDGQTSGFFTYALSLIR